MALSGQLFTHSALMEDALPHDSWKNWFQLHGPKLLLCARQWTRCAADAEDVLQDAFVRFWRHQRGLPGDPVALLVTSIRRAACDLARRQSRRGAREERAGPEMAEPCFLPAASVEGEERRAAIEEAMRRLPGEQREVLVLKIWGELTFEQIGAALDVSTNTAASRYRYALAALRRELSTAECHG
jgi:RNA polymerase sigma-70 factor (ECF subfamily)